MTKNLSDKMDAINILLKDNSIENALKQDILILEEESSDVQISTKLKNLRCSDESMNSAIINLYNDLNEMQKHLSSAIEILDKISSFTN